jgi:alkylated DNA repair dioxygenase AlkB
MIANSSVVEEPGGPDEMFEDLQGMDIGLRRRPLEGGMLKGGMFTRHFAVNYGMPYKFIAATESHPFPEASHPVSKARSRLNWAARHCLARPAPSSSSSSPTSEQDEAEAMNTSTSSTPALHDFNIHPFNEVLALGYFEGQRISYHDDGESGLGPTIATLSLGAPGMMRIRLKQKHHLGVSNAGIYTDTPPLPGCLQYDARHRLVSELSDLKARVSPSKYRKRLKQIPKELGLKASGNAKDVLTMRVAHGDVVLMHGEALQRYYEHSVEHAGKLRFAMTCRYIDPDSLKEGERPGYVVGEDEGGYDGSLLGRGVQISQVTQDEDVLNGGDERDEDSATDHSL